MLSQCIIVVLYTLNSQNEMMLVLGLGVSPERIIYANPNKQISHLKFAASKGVSLMTFDGEEELRKIKEHFPQAKYVSIYVL